MPFKAKKLMTATLIATLTLAETVAAEQTSIESNSIATKYGITIDYNSATSTKNTSVFNTPQKNINIRLSSYNRSALQPIEQVCDLVPYATDGTEDNKSAQGSPSWRICANLMKSAVSEFCTIAGERWTDKADRNNAYVKTLMGLTALFSIAAASNLAAKTLYSTAAGAAGVGGISAASEHDISVEQAISQQILAKLVDWENYKINDSDGKPTRTPTAFQMYDHAKTVAASCATGFTYQLPVSSK